MPCAGRRPPLVDRAANARTASKADRLSILAYLAAKPALIRELTAGQLRRLDTLFADGKKARPELAEAWKKLVTK